MASPGKKTVISVDPITRIEGHLKVEVEIDKGFVVDAKTTGGMYRGFNTILRDRHPRDAVQIVQRICGVCPVSHAIASSMAIENACKTSINENGRITRNLMLGGNYLQSNILHFYHLAGQDYFRGPGVVPFSPRYKAPDLRLPSNVNSQMSDQYIEALRVRQVCHELVALLGGRMPHQHGVVAGGVAQMPTKEILVEFGARLSKVKEFIEGKYLPMAYTISKYYMDLFEVAHGYQNVMCVGSFPLNDKYTDHIYDPGVYIDGKDLPFDEANIFEEVRYSWFKDVEQSAPIGGANTEPDIEKPGAYSFVKAPVYDKHRIEVGPAARMWINNVPLSDVGKKYLKEYFGIRAETTRDLGKDRVFSLMGRNLLRAEEVIHMAEIVEKWLYDVVPGEETFVSPEIPDEGEGLGFVEAPRGSLVHYIKIKNKKIDEYEVISASMWNCSPRDNSGARGAVEEALIGIPIKDSRSPVNIGRVIRAFDP